MEKALTLSPLKVLDLLQFKPLSSYKTFFFPDGHVQITTEKFAFYRDNSVSHNGEFCEWNNLKCYPLTSFSLSVELRIKLLE